MRLVIGLMALLWVLVGAALLLVTGANPLVALRFDSPAALLWVLGGAGIAAAAVLGERRPRLPAAPFDHLSDGVMMWSPRRGVRWRNTRAADLCPDPLPETITAMARQSAATRRGLFQIVEASERLSVRTVPLWRREVLIVVRPAQSVQHDFYENFIHRVVHDMRNPLAGIVAHAANLSADPTVSGATMGSAHTIEREAKRLARLVDSLLFDARLAYVPLDRRQLDLADVLEEAIFTHDEQAMKQGKTLELETPATALPIHADRDLLVRAFENLIDNSIKYTGENGRLAITVSDEGEGYTLTFADNGVGIDPAYLPERIFEPLTRVQREGSGSGLGLAIVQKIVRMHGGAIRVKSTVDEGTTFTIRLPKGAL
jgi:signal transduction histidine kinase